MQYDNVADKYPEKLKELEDLFWAEAASLLQHEVPRSLRLILSRILLNSLNKKDNGLRLRPGDIANVYRAKAIALDTAESLAQTCPNMFVQSLDGTPLCQIQAAQEGAPCIAHLVAIM
jgi:hypothetical protein